MASSEIIASGDRQKIVQIAHGIVDGTISIIAGARQLRVFALTMLFAVGSTCVAEQS